MSTTARPVTQIVETAVKRATWKGAAVPSALEMGSMSSSVQMRMMLVKMTTANREGLCCAKPFTQS